MALKNIPGIGVFIIVMSVLFMIWQIIKHYTGVPGLPEDAKRIIEHVVGIEELPVNPNPMQYGGPR